MQVSSSRRFIENGRTGVWRSVMVGVSLGMLMIAFFGGCSPKSGSPPPSQGKALPPPPPPPSTPSSTAATTAGNLPKTDVDAGRMIPAWAGQQQDEPFSVRQFLESRSVPPDNAAPLYFAALAEIDTNMYMSNPPASWPWSSKNIPERVRTLYKAVNDLSDYDKLLQGAFSATDVESLLTEAQPALKKLDEAQQRPQCMFVVGMDVDSLLPHAQSSRQFCRVACVQLYHARLKGDFGEAEQAVRRTLRLSRDIRPRGVLVVQLVSCVLDRMILHSVADLTLGQRGLTARDCDRLMALLLEHERKGVSLADEGFRMEYILLRNALDAMQKGRLSPDHFSQLIGGDPGRILREPTKVNWQAEITACNTFFAHAIAFVTAGCEQVPSDAWMEKETTKIESQNAPLVRTILPACDGCLEGILRARTDLAGIECLTAVRRYTLKHGSLPDNLDVAVREAGLTAVPTDPYSGGPMHYKVIGGKPVVYSVGFDRKDDGGTVDWDNGKKPGDFIFRIRE
jgi:hypothetical protein